MVKSLRLTWGFSLCKMNVASALPDGISELVSCVSSSRKFGSLQSRIKRMKLIPKSPQQHDSEDTDVNDIELALLITPPKLVNDCTQNKHILLKSAAGTRIFVYFVSLALSLAALSILKLHELLEWLLSDSSASAGIGEQMQSKSAIIAEILRETARRCSTSLHTTSKTSNKFAPLNVFSQSADRQSWTFDHTVTHNSEFPPSFDHPPHVHKPFQEPESTCDNGCFHFQQSSNCLLCHLACSPDCSSESLFSYRQPVKFRTKSVTNYFWSPPSRLNAGICRSQVSLGAAPGVISVDFCSKELCRLSGLQIAAELGKWKSSRRVFSQYDYVLPETTALKNNLKVDRSTTAANVYTQSINSLSSTSDLQCDHFGTKFCQKNPFFTQKKVALVAPTSKNVVNIVDLHHSVVSKNKILSTFPVFQSESEHQKKFFPLLVVEEIEDINNIISCDETASSVKNDHTSFLLSSKSATLLARLAVTITHNKLVQDQSTELIVSCSDVATSPIPESVLQKRTTVSHFEISEDSYKDNDLSSSIADDKSDADGFELDDDGVWLNSDFIFSLDDSCLNIISNSKEIHEPDAFAVTTSRVSNNNEQFIPSDEIFDLADGAKHKQTHNTYSNKPNNFDPGQFSGLVELTSSISNDLLLLQTGYNELINRVQSNRIELNNVQERLGYVWNEKDMLAQSMSDHELYSICEPCSDLGDSFDDRSIIGSSMIQSSVLDDSCTSFLSSSRPAPLGQSFHPEVSSEVICCCNCHESKIENVFPDDFMSFSKTNSNQERKIDHGVPDIVHDTVKNTAKTSMIPYIELSSSSISNFVYPDLSFEDDDAIQWSISEPREIR